MSLKGNAARPLPSLDAMVNRAICELFPDQTIPDEQNFRADGSRFKAPDHFVPTAEIDSSGQRSTGPLLTPHHPPAGALPRAPGPPDAGGRSTGKRSTGPFLVRSHPRQARSDCDRPRGWPTPPGLCRPGVRRFNRSTGAIDRAKARPRLTLRRAAPANRTCAAVHRTPAGSALSVPRPRGALSCRSAPSGSPASRSAAAWTR